MTIVMNNIKMQRKLPKNHNKLHNLLIIISIYLLFLIHCLQADASNLIENPGFESGLNDKALCWVTTSRKAKNSIQWISDDVHSGDRSMKLFATVPENLGYSMAVGTDFILVPENVYIEFSAWIKAKDITNEGGWYRGRIVLYMFDKNKEKIIHQDIQLDGSISDWTKIRINRITPKNTEFMKISFALTSCTGTMWVDDVELSIIQEPPTVSISGIDNPVIIPSPWKANFSDSSFPIGSLAIVVDTVLGKQNYLEEEMKEFFEQVGISDYKFFEPDAIDISHYKTQILVGDLEHTNAIFNQFKSKFSDNTAQDVGNQGYFLSVTEETSQNIIYLGANSDQGRFYGFQTLKQALNSIAEPEVYIIDILDAPTLERRGIAMGVQWFSKQNDAISRLSELKGNYVVNEGSYLNYKFLYDWRSDFTPHELVVMQNYLSLCQKHFISPRLNFGPRSSDPVVNPVQFSSDSEINILAKKMKKLYAIGFRTFGINFDDVGNVGQDILLIDQDKTTFGDDIGKAHSSFVQAVYNQIKDSCTDIDFTVIPMHYNNNSSITDKQQNYLSAFATISPQIKVIACTLTDESILSFKELTKRTITIWDNFFTMFQSSDFTKEYTWPILNSITWSNNSNESSIDGFVFLPIVPDLEDISITSWKTSADYMWSPARYIPLSSFQKAMAQYKGASGLELLEAPKNLKIETSQ